MTTSASGRPRGAGSSPAGSPGPGPGTQGTEQQQRTGISRVAHENPERIAIRSPEGDRTFGELDARANQLARLLRDRGVQPDEGVSLLSSNRPEFAETLQAALRIGVRITPINWHLTADEIAYIVDDSEAKALVVDARFGDTARAALEGRDEPRVRLAFGGPVEGFESYEDALAAYAPDELADPVPGRPMLYTSGTTGRPKGVNRSGGGATGGAGGGGGSALVRFLQVQGYRPGEDAHLVTGPLYHAAPLNFSLNLPLAFGVAVVLMDRFDPEETLRLIERYGVTHTHMVPTMFHRLLSLPEEVRSRYDTSTLRFILHGAAPCPVPVKQGLIDWLGPIVHEYYAATEGFGTFITAEEWLTKPGSVGKPDEGQIQIRDPEGQVLGENEIGTVYIRAPEGARFEYFKDSEKTARTYSGDYYTLGDMGYLDSDGYLFLTGRTAELIISGGVNIYPAEIDNVLLTHPSVADVATVGVPNEEFGEEVKAVVQLKEGVEPSEKLSHELLEYCRERLAGYKRPRSVDFVDELPRHDTGKVFRGLVRDRYLSQEQTQS